MNQTPTQVERPLRTTLRSVFQALVSFAAIAPLIVVALAEAGIDVSTIPAIATGLVVMAGITRVMAVPAVEEWLRRFLPFLAANPENR